MSKEKVYKMSLIFTVDISLVKLNNIVLEMNINNNVIQDAFSLNLIETLPFIPQEDTIKRYENILLEELNKVVKDYKIEKVKFSHFEYVKEKDNDKYH